MAMPGCKVLCRCVPRRREPLFRARALIHGVLSRAAGSRQKDDRLRDQCIVGLQKADELSVLGPGLQKRIEKPVRFTPDITFQNCPISALTLHRHFVMRCLSLGDRPRRQRPPGHDQEGQRRPEVP